jgi:hypothetical protein
LNPEKAVKKCGSLTDYFWFARPRIPAGQKGVSLSTGLFREDAWLTGYPTLTIISHDDQGDCLTSNNKMIGASQNDLMPCDYEGGSSILVKGQSVTFHK